MHLVPLVFYAAAAAAYLTHFAWRDPRAGRLATALLGGGVLAHTFLIGMQTVSIGHAPLVGTTAAVSAFVWLLGLSYLYIELTTDERAMGVFVAPLLVALYLIPALDPAVSPRPPLLQSPLFTVHIVSMLFAYASFALAFVLGLTYVLLFKEIKAQAPRLLLRAPAVAAGARRDERPRRHRRLAVPDPGHRHRRPLGDADPDLVRSARAGDVDRRSEDPRGARLLGHLFRSRCSRAARSAGAAGGRRGCRRWRS